MKKTIFLTSILLFGCTINTKNQPPMSDSNTQLIKKESDVLNERLKIQDNKTRLLYYYVSPDRMAQSMSSIKGTFYWQDGCIYLLNLDENKNIIKKTAMFPELPKDAVQWHEETKTLILKNYSGEFQFKMGDHIYTNGRSINSIPENLTLNDKDDEKCLSKDGIAIIGTLDIEKSAVKHLK